MRATLTTRERAGKQDNELEHCQPAEAEGTGLDISAGDRARHQQLQCDQWCRYTDF